MIDKEQHVHPKQPHEAAAAAVLATSSASAVVLTTTWHNLPVVVTFAAIQKNDVVQKNGVKSYKVGVVPVGFSGGFGLISGIFNSEDNLSHPMGFSNIGAYDGFSEKSLNNDYFLSEIKKKKTFDIGKAFGQVFRKS